MKILVVDDETPILELIKYNLQKEGFSVITAENGSKALEYARLDNPDLILLDLMLPGLSGENLITKIKSIPIIVLSAKINPEDKINCLLNGANDYITKPFNTDELLARIKVQLRINKKENKQLVYQELKLLNDGRTLLLKDIKISLTKTEYAIIKQLILNGTEVISKNRLLESISILLIYPIKIPGR